MIEADFQREYNMNLMEEIEQGLSWRRFLVLLGHFGRNSITALSLSGSDSDSVIEDEDKAEDFLKGW